MARVYGIKKRLAEQNIDPKLAKEIIGNGDLVEITARMETLLDPQITIEILDACACGTGRRELAGIRGIDAETLKDKIDRIAHLGDFHSQWNVRLNQDNTVSAGWAIGEKDHYACVCSAVVHNAVKVRDLTEQGRTMPLTYCFCCAGHCRRHLERLLNIQLKHKEVISSPIHSKGEKPCEFMFEIV